MKRLILLAMALFLVLGPATCVWAQKKAPTQLEMNRMELRALAAEIQIIQQNLNEKIERARSLQAAIQAEEVKQQKNDKKEKKK